MAISLYRDLRTKHNEEERSTGLQFVNGSANRDVV